MKKKNNNKKQQKKQQAHVTNENGTFKIPQNI